MKLTGSGFQIDRYVRFVLVSLVAIAATLWLTTASAAAVSSSLEIQVYRDPSCRCCGGWIDNLTAQGFQPTSIPTADMDALKQQYGVPNGLASCHTAVIDGYVIEGHVPAADIKRLLIEHPAVVGIAVPGMPMGTPGMESEGIREPFTVSSFDQRGHTVRFNQYWF